MLLREKLIEQKKNLEEELREERVKWNDFLQGEGPWAGHEHSLHESQATRFRLLEVKIDNIEKLLADADEVDAVEIEAEVNGKRMKLVITEQEIDIIQGQKISKNSPVGDVLLRMGVGDEENIVTPSGDVKLVKHSHRVY